MRAAWNPMSVDAVQALDSARQGATWDKEMQQLYNLPYKVFGLVV
jgi:hypothetical protein